MQKTCRIPKRTKLVPPSTIVVSAERELFERKRRAARIIGHYVRRRRWRILVGQANSPLLIDVPFTGVRLHCLHAAAHPYAIEAAIGPSHTVYAGKSLGVLCPVRSVVRRSLIGVVESVYFQRAVAAAIAANCALLMADPHLASHGAAWCDAGLLVLFTVEMAYRLLAMGVWHGRAEAGHETAFFHSPWRTADFVLICLGWLPLLLRKGETETYLRVLRAARPLRAAIVLPGLRRQTRTLLRTLPALRDVCLLAAFFICMFALVGMQLFKGLLSSRCYDINSDEPVAPDDGVCALPGGHARGLTSAQDNGVCAIGQECRPFGSNPLHGTVSFDHFGAAAMTSYQCSTLEGWSQVMYMLQTVAGPVPGALWAVSISIFGLFVVNIFLAVLWHEYAALYNKKPVPLEPPPHLRPRGQLTRAAPEAQQLNANSDQQAVLPLLEGSSAKSTGGGGWLPCPALLPSPACRAWAERVVASRLFRRVAVVLVSCAFFVPMLERDGMPAAQHALVEAFSVTFTLLLGGEIALRLLASGSSARYLRDAFNRLDCALLACGAADVAVALLIALLGRRTAALAVAEQALRALRGLRALKLARGWGLLQREMRACHAATRSLADLLLLLLLLLFLFGVVGAQAFDATTPHFGSVGSATMAAFVCVTGEDWVDYWREVVPTAGPLVSGGYFVALLSLGSYVVFNLLVAAIIAGVAEGEAEAEGEGEGELDAEAAEAAEKAETEAKGVALLPSLPGRGLSRRATRRGRAVIDVEEERALLLFGPSHPLRVAANALIEFRLGGTLSGTTLGATPLLEGAVVALTVGSCARLTLATCHDDQHPSWYATAAIDDAATLVSAVELCARLIGGGATLPRTGYLRSPWRRFDAAVVAVALLEWVSGLHGTLIVLRVLRPLWLLLRVESTRKLLVELASAVPRVAQFMALYLALLCSFGVLGVQLLSGRLGSCVMPPPPQPSNESMPPSERLRSACVAAGGSWYEAPYGTFDNIGAAALMLFEVSSLARWAEIMESSLAAAPTPELAPLYGAYFVVWVLFGGLVLVNMVVGVIVDRFAESHREHSQWLRDLHGRQQQQWSEAMHHLQELTPSRRPRPPRGAGETRWRCYRLVTAAPFERGVLGLIWANTLAMALDGVGVAPWRAALLDFANAALLTAFTLELVAKLLAFGGRFWSDGWNQFDALVVGGGLLDLAANSIDAFVAHGLLNPSLLRLLRLLRVTRALRAIRSHRGLRSLLGTLVACLPDLANVLGVFGVLIFVFSAVSCCREDDADAQTLELACRLVDPSHTRHSPLTRPSRLVIITPLGTARHGALRTRAPGRLPHRQRQLLLLSRRLHDHVRLRHRRELERPHARRRATAHRVRGGGRLRQLGGVPVLHAVHRRRLVRRTPHLIPSSWPPPSIPALATSLHPVPWPRAHTRDFSACPHAQSCTPPVCGGRFVVLNVMVALILPRFSRQLFQEALRVPPWEGEAFCAAWAAVSNRADAGG